MSDARAVSTPFGPGVSLYPDSNLDAQGERSLFIAIWYRAIRDARWLDAIEELPRSTWTPTQVTQYRRVTCGVLDPRIWLAEQRAA